MEEQTTAADAMPDETAEADSTQMRVAELARWLQVLMPTMDEPLVQQRAQSAAQRLREAEDGGRAKSQVDAELERLAGKGCLASQRQMVEFYEEERRGFRRHFLARDLLYWEQRAAFSAERETVKLDRVCTLFPAVPAPRMSYGNFQTRLWCFSKELRTHLSPPQSYWTVLLCLQRCGIWLPRDLRIMILGYCVSVASPLLRFGHRLPSAIRLWAPAYIRVPAGTLRCIYLTAHSFKAFRRSVFKIKLRSQFVLVANGAAVLHRLQRIETALCAATKRPVENWGRVEELRFCFRNIPAHKCLLVHDHRIGDGHTSLLSMCVDDTITVEAGKVVPDVLYIQVVGIASPSSSAAHVVLRLLTEGGARIA